MPSPAASPIEFRGHPEPGSWSPINIKEGSSAPGAPNPPSAPPPPPHIPSRATPPIDGFPRLHDPVACGQKPCTRVWFQAGSKIRKTTVARTQYDNLVTTYDMHNDSIRDLQGDTRIGVSRSSRTSASTQSASSSETAETVRKQWHDIGRLPSSRRNHGPKFDFCPLDARAGRTVRFTHKSISTCLRNGTRLDDAIEEL